MNKYWHHKPEVNISDLQNIKPELMMLFAAFVYYCNKVGKLAVITSIITDSVVGRKSKTHDQGRAFDARALGWSDAEVNKLVKYFNRKFVDIAAISASDREPRAVVHHKVDGNAYHFHFQVKP